LAVATYTHRAFFHDTDDELLDVLVPFVLEGIEADERVVVVVTESIGESLRGRIGSSDGFDVWDSTEVYTYPVRTLAGYVDTVRAGTEDGRRMRVAGQPIWEGLTPLEIAEWTCLEAACNLVFAESPLLMLCLYDTSRLDPSVIAAARRTHPEIRRGAQVTASPEFAPVDHQSEVRASELPPRPESSEAISIFSPSDIEPVASFVEAFAESRAMADSRITALTVTVRALLTQATDYRLGPAQLHIWATTEELTYEIESHGSLASPFAGYLPPSPSGPEDGGLWVIGQQCDLIAVRERSGATTVRLNFCDYLVPVRPQCNGVDELLGVYALRACDAEEMALVEEHLTTCDECKAELETLSHVVGLMHDPGEGHADG
jgi:MEDS: MEthanogen/methylotroph, DcmR Sensory domain/Putative zinc-finger